MKRKLLFIITLIALAQLCPSTLLAQENVNFEFYDGIEDGELKRMMECNASRLLTAINVAQAQGGNLNYSGIDIDDLAVYSIEHMWLNIHILVVEDDILEHCICIKSQSGEVIAYQVRNIKVGLIPQYDGYDGGLSREISITFNSCGAIIDFNITLDINQYQEIFKEGERLADMDRRMQILHFVEQFLCAYINKDIDYIRSFYSDDLWIFNNGFNRVRRDDFSWVWAEKMESQRHYLKKIERAFSKSRYVNVKFDSLRIVRHPIKQDFYCVTIAQNASLGDKHNGIEYADEGHIFMIWDFSDDFNPQILFRTWQSVFDSRRIFELSDFKI